MLRTKCNTLNEQKVICLDWTNVQWPPPPSVYSPPENIPHSTAEAYKGLKWLVFIGANNIRCFYLRLCSEAMMVVSSLGTHLKLFIYIYVDSESHLPNIFFFFLNLILPVLSSVPGEQTPVRSSCGAALWNILVHIFVLCAERRNNETRQHQTSIK